MLAFEGELSPRLYARALRTHAAGLTTIGVLLFLPGLAGTINALRNGVPPILPLLLMAFGLFVALRPELAARRRLRATRASVRGHADAERFVLESPQGRVDVRWAELYRAMEGRGLMILYTAPVELWVVADSFFASPTDWQTFRGLVAANVPLRPRTASPLFAGLLWAAILVALFAVWTLLRRMG